MDTIGACVLFEFGEDPKRPDITFFSADQQEQAILSYANAEQRLAFEDGDIAPILVSVSSIDRLPLAYQTFFFDCSPYVDLIGKLMRIN
jgi:hypothetical protein